MTARVTIDQSKFLELLRNPNSLDHETIESLGELILQFPYFQTAQLIYTANLFKESHPQFNAQLKKAAAYALDRKKLRELIEEIRQHDAPSIPWSSPAPGPKEPEPTPKATEPPMMKDEPLSSLREDNMAEQVADSFVSEQEIESVSEEPKPVTPLLTKEELIERFIMEEPRISVPRTAFFNPATTAMKSMTDDEEIVTETLAILFFKQGNPSKAIKIYEKLSLLFPEKSSYFAAQIKKISSKE